MARSYKRDSNGRFAGGGGSSGGRSRPAAKSVSRGTNRLTRDNAGKITGTGNGATARGGRLRTAAGNQRATQTARIKGSPSGVMKGRVARNPVAMGKAGAGKAAKPYGRGVDAAKAERITGRLQRSPNYQAKTKRLRYAKEAVGVKTRQRAADFLSKQAGLQKTGTSMGRTQWKAPDGMTRGQMMQNIAAGIPKQAKRSTARTGNKAIVTRAAKREQKIAEKANPPRVSYMHGGDKPKSPAPTGLSQRYSGATGRGSKALATAASRQRSRRGVAQSLAGTGRLMSPAARISRGRASQTNIFGGRSTAYGKLRRR